MTCCVGLLGFAAFAAVVIWIGAAMAAGGEG